MKMLSLAKRNIKEIIRDPINPAVGLGFPVVVMLLLSAISANVPVDIYSIGSITPGMCVFGLSFMTLFSATLISKDRSSALLERLYTTPLRATDFILGYTIPVLPIAMAQAVITYAVALCMGLKPTVHILTALLAIAPISVLYIALGLLFGSILNDKAVGGICGALMTNLSAWLSGTWFDLKMVGGGFEAIAKALPFYHATELERAALFGDFSSLLPHLGVVAAYSLVALVLAVLLFLRQMRK